MRLQKGQKPVPKQWPDEWAIAWPDEWVVARDESGYHAVHGEHRCSVGETRVGDTTHPYREACAIADSFNILAQVHDS